MCHNPKGKADFSQSMTKIILVTDKVQHKAKKEVV